MIEASKDMEVRQAEMGIFLLLLDNSIPNDKTERNKMLTNNK